MQTAEVILTAGRVDTQGQAFKKDRETKKRKRKRRLN
jgi:hypothetical protein